MFNYRDVRTGPGARYPPSSNFTEKENQYTKDSFASLNRIIGERELIQREETIKPTRNKENRGGQSPERER